VVHLPHRQAILLNTINIIGLLIWLFTYSSSSAPWRLRVLRARQTFRSFDSNSRSFCCWRPSRSSSLSTRTCRRFRTSPLWLARNGASVPVSFRNVHRGSTAASTATGNTTVNINWAAEVAANCNAKSMKTEAELDGFPLRVSSALVTGGNYKLIAGEAVRVGLFS